MFATTRGRTRIPYEGVSHVYFVHHSTWPFVKMGKSNNILKRIDAMGSGEFNLTWCIALQVGSAAIAYAMESMLREMLKAYHVSPGEVGRKVLTNSGKHEWYQNSVVEVLDECLRRVSEIISFQQVELKVPQKLTYRFKTSAMSEMDRMWTRLWYKRKRDQLRASKFEEVFSELMDYAEVYCVSVNMSGFMVCMTHRIGAGDEARVEALLSELKKLSFSELAKRSLVHQAVAFPSGDALLNFNASLELRDESEVSLISDLILEKLFFGPLAKLRKALEALPYKPS